jgi:hypothetical protein
VRRVVILRPAATSSSRVRDANRDRRHLPAVADKNGELPLEQQGMTGGLSLEKKNIQWE